MRKRITLLVAALMLTLTMAFGSLAAFAAPPSQEQCEAQGGTFTKQQGQVSCVIVTEQEGKNPKFTQETETTTTGQGNISNKQEQTTTDECQQDGATRDNCPPGQFK